MTDASPTNPADGHRDPAPLRIAILSDTHGWVDPRVLRVIADCDLVVHAGDIGNAAVMARLQPRRGVLRAVRGNNDRPLEWPSADLGLLATIPSLLEIGLPGGTLVVIHGHQTSARIRHERLRRRFPQARAVVCGHSHRLMLDQDARPWILNPGAAGRTRVFGGPTCLVLSADEADWQVAIHRFQPLKGPRDRNVTS